jgi:hypothetical protein
MKKAVIARSTFMKTQCFQLNLLPHQSVQNISAELISHFARGITQSKANSAVQCRFVVFLDSSRWAGAF